MGTREGVEIEDLKWLNALASRVEGLELALEVHN